jgi:ORF6C domain
VVEDLRQIAKISAVQAEYIQRAIKRIATRYQQRTKTTANIYERLFAQFKIDMGIPRYDALPASKYDAAVGWLRQQATSMLPDDPDALPPHQEQLL